MQTAEKPSVLTIDLIPKYYPGITKSASRRLVLSGAIPSRRIGVKYLVTPEAIERWLQGEPQTAKSATSGGGIRRVEDKI